MRNLVDTHLLLWVVSGSEKISSKARYLLTEPGDEYYFSTASLWEIAIKRGIKKARMPLAAEAARTAFIAAGFRELPVSGVHACAVETLPPKHKDPFDRMLVVQAKCEGVDEMFKTILGDEI